MDTESTVRPADSSAPADWIVADAREHWAQTVRWGPRGFAVYARVDFPWHDGEAPDQNDTELTRSVFELLAAYTAKPEDCLAAVWEGWGGRDLTPTDPAIPRVAIPEREMLLFRCTLADLPTAPEAAWGESTRSGWPIPHLSWPSDRSWCVACDVDEELAFTVACSEEAYAALAAALPGQVRRATWGDPEPMYADSGAAQPIDPRGLGEPIPPGAPGWQRYATVGLLGGFGLGGMHDG